MSRFQKGDKVLVDGNLVAEIHTWDEPNNRLVLQVNMRGGSTNLIYGHISQYKVERLMAEAITESSAPAAEVVAEEDADEG